MSHSMERICIERLVLEPCPYQEPQGAAFFFSWARTFSGQRGSGGWVRVALTAPTVSSNHGLTTARIVTGWSDVDQLSI